MSTWCEWIWLAKPFNINSTTMTSNLLTPQSLGHTLQSSSSFSAAFNLAGIRPKRYVVTAAGV